VGGGSEGGELGRKRNILTAKGGHGPWTKKRGKRRVERENLRVYKEGGPPGGIQGKGKIGTKKNERVMKREEIWLKEEQRVGRGEGSYNFSEKKDICQEGVGREKKKRGGQREE